LRLQKPKLQPAKLKFATAFPEIADEKPPVSAAKDAIAKTQRFCANIQ
jgi:hypothetical protein